MRYTVKDYFTKNDRYRYPVNQVVLEDAFHKRIAQEELTKLTVGATGIPVDVVRVSLWTGDRYAVTVGYDGRIELRYGTRRALRYALRRLNELTEIDGPGCRIRIAKVEDEPAFGVRGVIEGFYGSPYSAGARADLIACLSDWQMNSYFYAPKDDAYHREKWREPYPEKPLAELAALVETCAARDVDFVYCISPGKDFSFTEEADYAALFQKAEQAAALGVAGFALLMDDIDYRLKSRDEAAFGGPGEAHAALGNRFRARFPDFRHFLCPTEYIATTDSPYRTALRERLDKNVTVFWTGYNTVAETITAEDGKRVREIFGHELVLWDNYPVNDFEPKRRIYLGPLTNRSAELAETHVGMVSNPMTDWAASKIAVRTMADYMWAPRRYLPERSLADAISELFPQELAESVAAFVRLNASSVMRCEDGWLEDLFEANDYDALAAYYEETAAHCKRLFDLPEPYRASFRPYLTAFLQEAALFEKVRAGRVTAEEVLALANAPARGGRQTLLQHIKKRRLVSDAESVPLDEERERYWKI